MEEEPRSVFDRVMENLNIQRNVLAITVDYMWKGFQALIRPMMLRAWNTFLEIMGHVEDEAWDIMFASYTQQGLMSEAQAERMKEIKNLSQPFDLILYLYLQVTLVRETASINAESGANFLRRNIAKELRPSLPDVFNIMEAAFVAPEKTGEVRDIMREMGLSEEHIDLIFLAKYRLYDETTIRDLTLRGVLSPEKARERLRELGYTDTRIQELSNLWEIIPPIQDLITMVAREAFEPDIVQEIGLDAEFPSEQSEWMLKHGLSKDWQQRYWRAHWAQPSIEMGFEMLHREDPDRPGNSIIDMQQLDTLFRIQEIPPYWRDKLTKIAYQPYTRVDVRRMHDLGVLNDDQLLQAYKDLGYDSEKALAMANFTIRYNSQTGKDLSQSQVTKAYKKGLIETSDAIALIEQLGYSNAQADFIVSMAAYEQEIEYQEQIIDNIKDQYQDNRIDAITARTQLDALDLPSKAVDIYMATWELKRLNNVKKPSKTDLDKFLRNKVITNDQYRFEMEKLGYGVEYINWYEKLVSLNKAG